MRVQNLVVGAGEVGQALAEVLETYLLDVHHEVGEIEECEILHIAFPWQIGNFVEEVKRYDDMYAPTYVVVHSTVKPETCDQHEWVHSPVRGKHPNLLGGLLSFAKHYGGVHAHEVANALHQWFPDYVVHEHAATTETAKLLELVKYGTEIAYQKWVHHYCQRMDLDFDEVYSLFGQTYNDGWLELGHPEYMKPILEHRDGPVGGHCVVAGAKLLNEHHPNLYAQTVLMTQAQLLQAEKEKS